MRDNRIVYGGGSADISCSLAISQEADKVKKHSPYICFVPALVAVNTPYGNFMRKPSALLPILKSFCLWNDLTKEFVLVYEYFLLDALLFGTPSAGKRECSHIVYLCLRISRFVLYIILVLACVGSLYRAVRDACVLRRSVSHTHGSCRELRS